MRVQHEVIKQVWVSVTKPNLQVQMQLYRCSCTAAALLLHKQLVVVRTEAARVTETVGAAGHSAKQLLGSFGNIRCHHQRSAARGKGETTQDSNV